MDYRCISNRRPVLFDHNVTFYRRKLNFIIAYNSQVKTQTDYAPLELDPSACYLAHKAARHWLQSVQRSRQRKHLQHLQQLHLLQQAMQAWKLYVWQQRVEWKLQIRADVRHHHAVRKEHWRRWMEYVRERRVKRQRQAIAQKCWAEKRLRYMFQQWMHCYYLVVKIQQDHQWLGERALCWEKKRWWYRWRNRFEHRAMQRQNELQAESMDRQRMFLWIMFRWRTAAHELQTEQRKMQKAAARYEDAIQYNAFDAWRTYNIIQQHQERCKSKHIRVTPCEY